MANFQALVYLLIVFQLLTTRSGLAQTATRLSISAPITEELLGPSGPQAAGSVMRLTCFGVHPPPFKLIGTGFLHRSGVVITAGHVLSECPTKDYRVIFTETKYIRATAELDRETDLAILRPTQELKSQTLGISDRTSINVGEKLFIWGFPGGYTGIIPLLTISYVAATDFRRRNEPKGWIFNMPPRKGNSGGPVISANDGLVVGVFSAHIKDFPEHLTAVLKSLWKQRTGEKYSLPAEDGSTVLLSETQVIAAMLEALKQDRPALGFAVASSDLRRFLESKNIVP